MPTRFYKRHGKIRVFLLFARFSIFYRAENLCYQFVQGIRNSRTVPRDCLLDVRPCNCVIQIMLDCSHDGLTFRRDFTKDTEKSVSFFYSLDFQSSIAQKISAISSGREYATPATVPRDCLLDARPCNCNIQIMLDCSHDGLIFRRDFTKDTDFSVSFFYSLDFQSSIAQKISAIVSSDIAVFRWQHCDNNHLHFAIDYDTIHL